MRKAVITGALALVSASIALAGPINGSLPFATIDVSQNGTDLSVSTIISDTSTPTNGPGVGDFVIVPTLTDFGPFTLNLATVTSGGGVSLSNATYGDFVAGSGEIVSQSSSFLDVYLTGTYTPGPAFPVGTISDAASFRISINQSGSSLSTAVTLSSPPTGVAPEPATVALIGAALIGLAAMRRKKG